MYKSTKELKADAKESLSGRWSEAVKLNLVPSLIKIGMVLFTMILVSGVVFFVSKMDIYESSTTYGRSTVYESVLNVDGEDLYTDGGSASPVAAITSAMSSSSFSPILMFIMTFLTVGISFTFLDIVRRQKTEQVRMKDAFRLFNGIDFVPVLLINVLMYFFKMFWTMLFIIPGLIKAYSYSQSNFIYYDISSWKDTRSMGATSFITESRELMDGHKWRLFWLDITFIGWHLLGMMTGGIAYLWIYPYINATKAAFYNDLAKDQFLQPAVPEMDVEEDWTNF